MMVVVGGEVVTSGDRLLPTTPCQARGWGDEIRQKCINCDSNTANRKIATQLLLLQGTNTAYTYDKHLGHLFD